MFNLFNVINDTSNGFYLIFLDVLSLLSIVFGISVINSKNPIVSVLFLIGLFISISLNLIFLGFNFIGLSYLLVYVGAVSILFLFILMLINVRISELLDDTSNTIPLAIYTGFSFYLPVYLILNKIDNMKDSYTNIDMGSSLSSEKIQENIFMWGLSKAKTQTILNKTINDDVLFNSLLNNKNISLSHFPLSSSLIPLLPKGDEGIGDGGSGNGHDLKQVITNKNIIAPNIEDKSSELYLVSSNSWDNNLIDVNDITSIGNVLYSTYGVWLIICSVILLLAMIGAITITKKEKD